VTDSWRRILAGTALGIGMILFIALLFAILDLARIEQSYQGAIFQRAATVLRWLLAGQIVVVAGSGIIIFTRRKGISTRLALLASVVWVISAVDLVYVSLAGAIPR
jgi:hypothetical protein